MNVYSERRARFASAIEGNFAALVFAGETVMCSEDEGYPFKINRNFYYLTGLENESSVLLMSRVDGVYQETLFQLPYDEVLARWVGGRMSEEESREISGVEDVCECAELDGTIASLLNRTRRHDGFAMYFDLWHYTDKQSETLAIAYANKIRAMHPAVKIKDFYKIIAAMRLVKDDTEIAEILKAIAITKAGVDKMMKTIKPGMNEMVMEGVFNFVLMQNLCNENAFHTIAASGANATVLHYQTNNCVMEDGELFLCDLGATHNHYCADISRTFPVNGKFTERQKELYQLVLNAQKIVTKNAKAGMTLRQLNDLVVKYYEEELPKHGLNKGVREYYFHGVSHHLGLDTHDINGGVGSILKPGNVITNEPGLYIADEGIGIRIEDDLLIKENEAVVLSKDIVKEIADIEKLMNS